MATKKDIYNKINLLIEILNNNDNMHYSMKSNNEKWNNIMKDYYKIVDLRFADDAEIPYCRYNLNGNIGGTIYFKYEVYKNPDEDDLFSLLHEIGHIMTNNNKMKRCEEEFYATKWALNNKNKYNVNPSKSFLDAFQEYIWNWRERGIKCGAKNMPNKMKLKLIY